MAKSVGMFKGKMPGSGSPIVSGWSKGNMMTAGLAGKEGVLGKRGGSPSMKPFGMTPKPGKSR